MKFKKIYEDTDRDIANGGEIDMVDDDWKSASMTDDEFEDEYLGDKPKFLCDGCYYMDGKKEEFDIDLSEFETMEAARECVAEVIADYVYECINECDDFTLGFNVTDADGKFLFGGWYDEDATQMPEWSNGEIKFGDTNWWFSKINEDTNDVNDDSFLSEISTNKKDWVTVNESELDVYDKPSYKMMFDDIEEGMRWEDELRGSESVSGVYGQETHGGGYRVSFELEDSDLFQVDFGVDVNEVAEYINLD